ncbi:GNAT family N-acetyltransferase [Natronorubrum halophilum]|uniref:GNAT family N-acetyltransferase n=1 Tax=Natronorubrum halophilum TaxID=1702106 RepID=UPI000EF6882D|nr:N-acetyltransferase [Natronorubrum halophilum]
MSETIRPYEEDDLAVINEILSTTVPWTEYEATYRVDDAAVADEDLLAVATVDGGVTGFVWVVPNGAFDRSGYIKLIGVVEHAQGQGTGTALMDCAEQYVSAESTSNDVFLLVSDFNEAVQEFYRQHGYDRICILENYVENGISEYIFRKSIHDQ